MRTLTTTQTAPCAWGVSLSKKCLCNAGLAESLLVGLMLPDDELAAAALEVLIAGRLPTAFALSEELLAVLLSRAVLSDVMAGYSARDAVCAALSRYEGMAIDPEAEVALRHCIVPHALAQIVNGQRLDVAASIVCHHLRLHPGLARVDSGMALLAPCLSAHARAAAAADVTLLSVTHCQVPCIAERLFKSVSGACEGALTTLKACQPPPLQRRTSSAGTRPASPSSSAG